MKRTINGLKALRPAGNHPAPDHWEALRKKKLEEQGNACACCPNDIDSGYQLELHHRHYQNWGKEKPQDVVILCSLCHDYITSRFRVLDEYQVEGGSLPPPRPGLPEISIRPPEKLASAIPAERPGLPTETKSRSEGDKLKRAIPNPRFRPF